MHITNYTWNFGDGSNKVFVAGYAAAKSQWHLFMKPGLYIVRLTAANSMGSEETWVKVWVQGEYWFC